MQVVAVLERLHFVGGRVGDADPDEIGLIVATVAALVDGDAPNACAVPIEIGGYDRHVRPRMTCDGCLAFGVHRVCYGLKEPELPEAGPVQSGEDEMVDNGTAQGLGGRSQPAGRKAIRIARLRIPARMIVRQKHARAAENRRIGKD